MLDDANSTVMSILYGVMDEEITRRRSNLERFCGTYTQPLVNYLVLAKKLNCDEAVDVVHDFWVAKMLDAHPQVNLVSKYLNAQQNRETTSFRSYLAMSLRNFWFSRSRLKGEAKRREQVSLEMLEGWEPVSPQDEELFDAAWANHILSLVLNRVKQECESSRLKLKWTVFTKRILEPIAFRRSQPSYAEVAEELGLTDTREIGNALTTFRHVFKRNLQVVVQDYLPAQSAEESLAAAQKEIAELIAKLSRSGGLQLPLAEWGVVAEDSSSEYRLALDKLNVASLIQNDDDHRVVWKTALNASLASILDTDLGVDRSVRLEDLMAGKVKKLDVLHKTRAAAKRLGSATNEEESGEPVLNRKMYGLIYLVAIIIAKLECDADISTQSPAQLTSLAQSFASEEWVDANTRQWLNRFNSELNSPA
jgi:hypothetical protein